VEIPEEAAFLAARQAALARWQTGSADTTQMLMSVDAALLAALPYLAPAGDGGLRAAMEKLAGDMAYDSSDGGAKIRAVLDAHPAVPQPVDREALASLVEGAEHYDTCFKMLSPLTRNECTCLLADLRALLAGEQEQVEP
jgi:hypothetical protein